jgi:chromosome partitioning protein
MTSKIITVCNQKGGSGKTTTCMTLAAGLAARGFAVLVVDADPQGTATRWGASAPEAEPFPATVINLAAAKANVHRMVRDHVEHYDVVLVDCPPAVESPATQSALLISDLAIVPVIPRPGELWALERLFQLLGEMPELTARLLPTMLQNTTLMADALTVLGETPVPLMKSSFSARVAYAQGMPTGGTALTGRDAVARDEVDAAVLEVLELVGLPKRKPKSSTVPSAAPVGTSSKGTSSKLPSKASSSKLPSKSRIAG